MGNKIIFYFIVPESWGLQFLKPNRDDRIRTCDILLPKQARYQAALHPVTVSLHSMTLCSLDD
jgi:hypothetical protein